MELDYTICESARLSRDPRFDGRFFTAVTSTGIYCRPVCPAPSPKRANVRYYPTAAAAAEAGFRPCLRCRPEAAPGTPAWSGTSATVNRGLRLIAEGALDDGDVETLAARLGVGPRHLHRLFVRHLGASPLAVAQTRRLHFAKKLLDETDLPMAQVALAAGFGSVRRFNDQIRKIYARTPSQLRRLHQAATAPRPGQYVFQLAYRPPYDWDSLLDFLERRAIPGVEAVVDGRYRRSIALGGRHGVIDVGHAASACALTLQIRFPEPTALLRIVARVRRLFDLEADPATIARHFQNDALLGLSARHRPGLRIPGAWDGFELAVRAILGQQVTVAAASRRAGVLAHRLGEPLALDDDVLDRIFPTPARLASVQLDGMPAIRARAIQALGQAIAGGELRLEPDAAPEQMLQRLTAIPGIGDWTAQYIAMRALGEPDALPVADLVLLRAAGDGKPLEPKQLLAQAEAWRPWRAYAAMHLWGLATEEKCISAT
ncbi:MAG TPA: AlkA N-terminal domain-containing protein [Gammaproteobacteria bacterium]|nr:AlkA N-terminal domain-containing protein [Gammaproteobacteria bacterium]